MGAVKVLYQALISFFVLFVISKILGKKQIAQLEFTDYVIGISIGSIAADMVMEPNVPFYHFIIGMAVYGLLDYLISIFSRKGVLLKRLFIGRPLIIIEKGQINYKNLKKSKLDVNELVAQCRLSGFFNLSDIYYCIFETNGAFSIMPAVQAKPVTCKDLELKNSQDQLSLSLIIDGKIISKHLDIINKSKEWLLEQTSVENKADLKNILLASYDPTSKKISTFLKFKNL